MDPLDNPVWEALQGPQRSVAESGELAGRYVPEVSLFGAFPEPPTPRHWDAMAELVGPGGEVFLTGYTGTPPDGWHTDYEGTGLQMTGDALVATPAEVAALRPELDVVPLGGPEAPDMIDLIDLVRPGPFSPRTWELGGYVGIYRDDRLVAIAGQRFRPPGWCEISAVATHPDHRRQGLGEHLVRAVAAGIVARGEGPVLHVAEENTGAIRLYEAMGFVHRARVRFMGVRAPGGSGAGGVPSVPHPGS
jgi:ribosomal protein S18 acetylase RimI-like enzyme